MHRDGAAALRWHLYVVCAHVASAGIEVRFEDGPPKAEKLIDGRTKAIFLETMNPKGGSYGC